jgi:hypothetical protein
VRTEIAQPNANGISRHTAFITGRLFVITVTGYRCRTIACAEPQPGATRVRARPLSRSSHARSTLAVSSLALVAGVGRESVTTYTHRVWRAIPFCSLSQVTSLIRSEVSCVYCLQYCAQSRKPNENGEPRRPVTLTKNSDTDLQQRCSRG